MQQQAAYVPTGFGANDVQIMAGTFDDVSFDDVVQVLGLSRQCLRLLIRQGEAAISEVLLKAGQVLEARMPQSSDPENVFKALFGTAVHGSGLSFAVYHTEPTGPFPTPRCRLQEVYERVKSVGQGAAARAASVLRPGAAGAAGTDATVRIQHVPQEQAAYTSPGSSASRPDTPHIPYTQPAGALLVGGTAPQTLAPDALGKAVAAQLRPLLHEEIGTVLAQVQAQAQALHTMDGRLQVLPQLVAAELRAALAQHERHAAPKAAAAPAATGQRGLLIALAGGMAVLLLAVLALAVKVLR